MLYFHLLTKIGDCIVSNLKFKKAIVICIVLIMAIVSTSCSNTNADDSTPAPNNHEPIEKIEDTLYMTTVNVGYGDCIILQYNDTVCMVDTGEDVNVASVMGAMKLLGIDEIDALFLTHTHSDHIGGVPALAENYKIDKVYSATISETKKNGKNKIIKLVKKYNLNHQLLVAEETVCVGDKLCFEVLAPVKLNEEDDNDNSLILRVEINGKTILLTGDMQFPEEQTLIDRNIDLAADILKVGNHGNPDATSDKFAAMVNPSVALISTDREEDADSANVRVLAALHSAEIYITDEFDKGILLAVARDGDVKVTNLEIKANECRIVLKSVDENEGVFVLKNNGKSCDISGYTFVSEKNSYVFPKDTVIKENEMLIVECKNEDYGAFYNCYGNKLSEIAGE